jgi:hypothetical protein
MGDKIIKEFSSQFKDKVAFEAIRGVKTVIESSQEFEVDPMQPPTNTFL